MYIPKAHKLAKQHAQARKCVKEKEEKVSMITEKCNGRQPLLPKVGPQLRHSNTAI